MIFVEFSGREILDSNPKCWVNKKILELDENWVKITNFYVNYEGQIFGIVSKNKNDHLLDNEFLLSEVIEEEVVFSGTTDELIENPFEEEELPVTTLKSDPESDEVTTDDEFFKPTVNKSRSSYYEKFIDPDTKKLMGKCKTCGKTTKLGLMNQHIQSHLEGCQLCKYCGQTFSNRYKLNSHESNHKKTSQHVFPHDPVLFLVEENIIQKNVECTHCQSSFLEEFPRTIHHKSTQNCLKQCKRQFLDKTNLRLHKCSDQLLEVTVELEQSDEPQRIINKTVICNTCKKSNCLQYSAFIKGVPPDLKRINPKVRKSRGDTNIRELSKVKRISGESYVNRLGKLRPARKMGPPCLDNCKYKCKERISEEDRQEIFDHYWQLNSDYVKRQFIAQCLESTERKYMRVNSKSCRSANTSFNFSVTSGKERVCKRFFVRTLGIGEGAIDTVRQMIKQFGEVIDYERRGRHMNKVRIEESIQNEIRKYILDGLRITNDEERTVKAQEFIDCGGTLAAFHREYVVKCDNDNKQFGSYSKFKQIFYEEFMKNKMDDDRNTEFEECIME
ncbi:hypothetical protein ACFFRR_000637 [Megaselia abdita]